MYNLNRYRKLQSDFFFGIVATVLLLVVLCFYFMYVDTADGAESNKAIQRMSNSSAGAKLVGITSTPTTGVEVTGTYNATMGVHTFDVETTGFYTLWEDPLGGSSYTRRTDWSGIEGKLMFGGDILQMLDSRKYNTEWFGFKSGGDGNANCLALQAAVDTCYERGGGTVHIPKGDYTINNSSMVQAIHLKDGVTVSGEGNSTIIRTYKSTYTYSAQGFQINGVTNVCIKDLCIIPDPRPSVVIEHDHCILLYSDASPSTNITISNVTMHCTGDGVCIDNHDEQDSNIKIIGCHIYGPKIFALHWVWPVSRNGVSVVNGRGISITGNTMDGFNGPGCIDIEPNSGTDQEVHNVTISGNTFTFMRFGINVSGGNSASNIAITGNAMDGSYYTNDSSRACVRLGGLVENVTISGNSMIGGNGSIGGYSAVMIYNPVRNVNIVGNTISGGTYNGIQTFWNVQGINIVNNVISGVGRHGIELYGTRDDSTVQVANAGFESDTGIGWTSYGTPALVRSGTKYAGTYSWWVSTDAVNEGIQQTFDCADTNNFRYLTVRVRVVTDSVGGRVKLSCSNVRYWEAVNSTSESDADGGRWNRLGVVFKPNNGSATIMITGTDDYMQFYVDDAHMYKCASPAFCNITNNIITDCNQNNATDIAGVWLGDGYKIDISGNTISAYGSAVRPAYGVYVGNGLLSSITGNKSACASSQDLRVNNGNGLALSTIGMKNVSASTNVTDTNWPYAKFVSFFADSIPSGTGYGYKAYNYTGGVQGFVAPTRMRIVGVSAYFNSTITAGAIRVYPLFSNELEWNIHSSAGMSFGTLSSTTGGRYLLMDFPILNGYSIAEKGDLLTVILETFAATFVGGRSDVNITVMYE